MDEFDILKELEKLDDDIEPGFLRELRFEAPDELHSRIMNSIKQEMKPRSRFNYRRYTAFAVAAALLVFVYIGGGKSGLFQNNPITNNNSTSEIKTDNINVNHVIRDVIKSKSSKNEAAVNDSTKIQGHKKTTSPKATAKPFTGQVAVSDKNPAKVNLPTTKEKLPTANVNLPPTKVNLPPAKETKTPIVAVKPDTKIKKPAGNRLADVGNKENDEPTLIPSIKNPTQGAGTVDPNTTPDNNNKGGTGLAVIPPDSSAADNQSTKALNPSETVADNPSTNDPSIDSNTTIAAIDMNNYPVGLKIASISLDSFVNYEINLNMSQVSIIQFIKEKGTKLSEVVYKLNKSDYDELDKILNENSVVKNEVNTQSGEFVIIKMIMY
jgi:hypothetical protein